MILGTVLTVSMLAGCGGSDSSQTQAPAETGKETTAESMVQTSEEETGTQKADANNDFSGTLKLYGPGLFTTVGEDGSTDIVTGVSKPGYNVVIDRWKELYPNVDLQIETIPWDNWKAACQTAALSGDVDIILHGASIVPVCEPLTGYLEKNPEVKDAVGMMAMRKIPKSHRFLSMYLMA